MRAMTTLLVPPSLLREAGVFFESCGSRGVEGTAMIAARADGLATGLVIPDQRAGHVTGCWVEVTPQGKLDLAASLRPGEIYAARIHSHPADAFHSATDSANPALTYPGALSIVVPYYGLGLRHGLNACAVYLRTARGWQELAAGVARDAMVRSC
jgi:hypothetical protein